MKRSINHKFLPLLPPQGQRVGRRGLCVRISPLPLKRGEGTAHPALRRVEALRIGESAACGSPSPRGEGRGEGEETLRTPAPLRIADEAGYSERRKTKLHTRQSDESLAVASRLPPHPRPLPQGEGTAHPALRRVEALRIGESAACGSHSPRGG